MSSFFDLTALSASSSSSPRAGRPSVGPLSLGNLDPPRVGAHASKLQLDPAVQPLREVPPERFGHLGKRHFAVIVLPGVIVDTSSDTSSALASSSSSSSSPVFGPRSCIDTVYVRASLPVPECDVPHGFSVTESLRMSSARRTLRKPPGEVLRLLHRLGVREQGRVMTGVASFFAAAMRSCEGGVFRASRWPHRGRRSGRC